MKKIVSLIICVFVMVAIITSCSKKPVYSVPTQAEITKFIVDKSLTVMAVKEADDFTIILFQVENKVGYYMVNKSKNKIYGSSSVEDTKGLIPIFMGESLDAKRPFVTMIMNDEEIFKSANYVEVSFEDGHIIKEDVINKGIILIYKNKKNDEEVRYNKITIYDEAGKVLYEDSRLPMPSLN